MVQQQFFFAPPPPLGPWGGVKNHLISITKPISKIFILNFVCVLTNARYKTYQMGLSFCCLGHAPGVGLWGAGGAQVVKFYNFKHGHVAYQSDRDDEQNRVQVTFSSYGQNGDFGARSNVINLSISKILIPNIVCVLTNKR